MSVTLVTGGAGYIGSHTAKALVVAGGDVVIYDDLSTGHAAAARELRQAFPNRQIAFVRGDIRDRGRIVETVRAHGVTAVVHMAARLLVAESVADPFGYYRANVDGTLTVLEAMAETGVSRFVFSSTAATFGEPVTAPIDEAHPQRPINAYGETKLAIERALPHIERATGIRWIVLRYFNAAGADVDGLLGEDHRPEEHLIPRALAAALGGPPLEVYGDDYPTPDGTCVRDYIHVADLADAHVRALAALERGRPSSAYNLGNGQGISVREILESVARVTGRPVPHIVAPRRAGDPSTLVASSARAMADLGWAPRHGAVDVIVATAWHWHSRHPAGYGPDESEGH
jgi:UDP-glucose-4-epimerase GalE